MKYLQRIFPAKYKDKSIIDAFLPLTYDIKLQIQLFSGFRRNKVLETNAEVVALGEKARIAYLAQIVIALIVITLFFSVAIFA